MLQGRGTNLNHNSLFICHQSFSVYHSMLSSLPQCRSENLSVFFNAGIRPIYLQAMHCSILPSSYHIPICGRNLLRNENAVHRRRCDASRVSGSLAAWIEAPECGLSRLIPQNPDRGRSSALHAGKISRPVCKPGHSLTN